MGGLSRGYLSARFAAVERRLYGRRLRPFCIEFYERLAAMGSPLMDDSPALVQPRDLYIAALVCSSDPLSPPRRLWTARNLISYWLRERIQNFHVERQSWLLYLADHYTMPRVWQKEDEQAKPLSAPWTLALESKLLECTSMSSREIRSESIARLVWLSMAHSERHGGDAVMSDQEAAIIAKARENWAARGRCRSDV